MYGYGYRYNSGLVVGAGGGAPFLNTYSLSFDGVDDYVDCGNISQLNGVTEASWSIWAAKGGTADYYLMSCYSSTSSLRQYLFHQYSDKLYIYLVNSGGTLRLMNRIDYTFNIDEWYHIGIVYNESEVSNADKVKVYINGILQINQTTGFALTSLRSTTAITSIGRAVDFTTKEYNGKIDEVAIFDSALTPTEITSIASAPTDLTDLSPIAWYRMGDNGAYKSPQWLIPNNDNKDKVSNYSFDFDGVDDFVNIPNNTDLNFSSAYSVSFWINTTSSALLSPISNQSKFLIRLYAPANQIRLQLYDGSNGFLNLDNTQVFNDGNWHHIAFTTEATTTTDKVIVYFDGVALTNKGTQTNIGSHLSAFAYEIGRNSGTWNFNGNIDEVSLYNSELSASQINDIYNGGEPTTISGAVAYYKMGEDASFSGGVWTVPDAVGSNDGTSNAMTIEDRVGEAPSSENNALSYNMDLVDRVTDTP